MHSVDSFYVVTKLILPSIGDLNFSKLNYDNTCAYVTAGNITLGKMHKYYKSLPLELFRALAVGAKYLPLCQYAKMV